MRRTALLLLLLPVAACGGDDDSASDVPACDSFVGQPTADVLDAYESPCLDEDGEEVLTVSVMIDCAEGNQLVWNDNGFGFDDGEWQGFAAGAELSPPPSAMESCS